MPLLEKINAFLKKYSAAHLKVAGLITILAVVALGYFYGKFVSDPVAVAFAFAFAGALAVIYTLMAIVLWFAYVEEIKA